MSIFRTDKIPSLNRIPKELDREARFCGRCERETEHILYLVPRKVVLLYVRNHAENVQASCTVCARSTVLTGEDRDRVLDADGS